MLGDERLERYRQIDIAQKYEELKVLMDMAWEDILRLSPGERNRRLEVWGRDNDQANRAMAERFAEIRA